MNLPVKLAILASASMIATSALAGGVDTVIVAPKPTNIVYIGGDLGYAVLATPDKNIADPSLKLGITGASHSTGNFAGGANVGVKHAFTPNVLAGAEFGWDYNGFSKYTETFGEAGTATAEVHSWDLNLLGTGTYLFNNGFNLFGKAGAASVRQTLTAKAPGYENNDVTHTTKVLPMVALGAGYQYKLLNFYVQYSHIFGKDANNFDDLVNVNNVDEKAQTATVSFKDVASVDAIKAGVSVNFAI